MVVDNWKIMKRLNLITLVIMVLFTGYVNAQKIHKWKDENGTIHYSKNPPPEQFKNETLKLQKQRKGDAACCSALRRVINSMLGRTSISRTKEYQLLVNSKDFNATELNNFVSSRVRSNLRNSAISQSGYDSCMNAGFNFCRVPLDSFDQVSPDSNKHQSWSGSGFYVSPEGHIVTNEHVVRSCKKIVIQPQKIEAKIISKDSKYDLALLKVDSNSSNVATFRNEPVVLGEEIITAGFPYKDILSSSIKITTGIVGSLAGIRNDQKVMQITAPIQPGNSGGPLIDSYGNIIGVIVSKLDSEFMIKLYKDIPQNVNFAIKGSHVKDFLTRKGIRFNQSNHKQKQDVTTISQLAQNYTVEINCIN